MTDPRTTNLDTIRRFFEPNARAAGGARVHAALFADGAIKQEVYPLGDAVGEYPAPVDVKHQVDNQSGDPPALDLDAVIWGTDDPGVVWAETHERGTVTLNGPPTAFSGHSVHLFKLADGLITSWRVYRDLQMLYPALGHDRPAEQRQDDEFERDWELWQRYSPMRRVEDVEPITDHGMRTRIKVEGDFDDSAEAQALREKNLATIVAVHSERVRQPDGRIWRATLFHRDGLSTLGFGPGTDSNDPLLKYQKFAAGEVTPTWVQHEELVSATGDPNVFWLIVKGEGGRGHTEAAAEKYGFWHEYPFLFVMDDGEIRLMHEYLDWTYIDRYDFNPWPPLPPEAFDFYADL